MSVDGKFMRKFLIIILIFTFLAAPLMPISRAGASVVLPEPGTMVSLSPAFEPALIKGLKVHPENPFRFDFIVDTGSLPLVGRAREGDLKEQSSKLIKYFLASLTIPEKDLWVNLSPYEKDRMIADNLGQTQMGQDMLAQDYILKQLTASLIYPEKDLGKAFWDKVYAKAQQMYGTTEIPVNTFSKVWIVADKADVFERGNVAYIVAAHLKVMLEEDYTAFEKNQTPTRGHVAEAPASAGDRNVSPPPVLSDRRSGGSTLPNDAALNMKATQRDAPNALASQIIRDVILPAIEEEINQGKNFAPLRQMFYSMILASWYKMALKDALLTQLYGNQSKVKIGVNAQDPTDKDKIFEQYLKAYKKGVFNYIKEDINQATQQPTPRKYFSGGLAMQIDKAMRVMRVFSKTSLPTRNVFNVSVLARVADQAMDTQVTLQEQPPLPAGAERPISTSGMPMGGRIQFSKYEFSPRHVDGTIEVFRTRLSINTRGSKIRVDLDGEEKSIPKANISVAYKDGKDGKVVTIKNLGQQTPLTLHYADNAMAANAVSRDDVEVIKDLQRAKQAAYEKAFVTYQEALKRFLDESSTKLISAQILERDMEIFMLALKAHGVGKIPAEKVANAILNELDLSRVAKLTDLEKREIQNVISSTGRKVYPDLGFYAADLFSKDRDSAAALVKQHSNDRNPADISMVRKPMQQGVKEESLWEMISRKVLGRTADTAMSAMATDNPDDWDEMGLWRNDAERVVQDIFRARDAEALRRAAEEEKEGVAIVPAQGADTAMTALDPRLPPVMKSLVNNGLKYDPEGFGYMALPQDGLAENRAPRYGPLMELAIQKIEAFQRRIYGDNPGSFEDEADIFGVGIGGQMTCSIPGVGLINKFPKRRFIPLDSLGIDYNQMEEELLASLRRNPNKKFVLVFGSKSGKTDETMANYQNALRMLIRVEARLNHGDEKGLALAKKTILALWIEGRFVELAKQTLGAMNLNEEQKDILRAVFKRTTFVTGSFVTGSKESGSLIDRMVKEGFPNQLYDLEQDMVAITEMMGNLGGRFQGISPNSLTIDALLGMDVRAILEGGRAEAIRQRQEGYITQVLAQEIVTQNVHHMIIGIPDNRFMRLAEAAGQIVPESLGKGRQRGHNFGLLTFKHDGSTINQALSFNHDKKFYFVIDVEGEVPMVLDKNIEDNNIVYRFKMNGINESELGRIIQFIEDLTVRIGMIYVAQALADAPEVQGLDLTDEHIVRQIMNGPDDKDNTKLKVLHQLFNDVTPFRQPEVEMAKKLVANGGGDLQFNSSGEKTSDGLPIRDPEEIAAYYRVRNNLVNEGPIVDTDLTALRDEHGRYLSTDQTVEYIAGIEQRLKSNLEGLSDFEKVLTAVIFYAHSKGKAANFVNYEVRNAQTEPLKVGLERLGADRVDFGPAEQHKSRQSAVAGADVSVEIVIQSVKTSADVEKTESRLRADGTVPTYLHDLMPSEAAALYAEKYSRVFMDPKVQTETMMILVPDLTVKENLDALIKSFERANKAASLSMADSAMLSFGHPEIDAVTTAYEAVPNDASDVGQRLKELVELLIRLNNLSGLGAEDRVRQRILHDKIVRERALLGAQAHAREGSSAKATDTAMAVKGGIDFNRAKLQMNVRKDGPGVQMQFDQAMIERIKRDGFDGLEFKIETIIPVTNLPMLLGLRKEEMEGQTQLAGV